MKLQTPNSKLQRNFKSQDSNNDSRLNSMLKPGRKVPGGNGPWGAICLATVVIIGLIGVAASRKDGLVVHEWGTFTSVQGGDGVLLKWKPLESSQLPKFVYDWKHPGLHRVFTGYLWGKGEITGLQRMETPVIYFYSPKEREVSASVSFPQGIITEWFPQAAQIGPCTRVVSGPIATADAVLHKAGVKPDVTVESLFDQTTAQQSSARWAHFHVIPPGDNQRLITSLPRDNSGSHYFSARQTDAGFVQVDSLEPANPAPEVEKFIFYRGVGNFSTPLRVIAGTGESIAVTNMSDEKVEHIFVLRVENGTAGFIPTRKLYGHEQVAVRVDQSAMMPVKEASEKLSAAMKNSLIDAGLYPREAAAMVATWNDSWFEEEGLRVLYILPRSWTDKTLPLKVDPAPEALTRVMVGRAEVLSPSSQQRLILTLTQAAKGDGPMTKQAAVELKRFGRFAEPALQLVSQTAPEAAQTGWKLLETARQTKSSGNLQTSNIQLQ